MKKGISSLVLLIVASLTIISYFYYNYYTNKHVQENYPTTITNEKWTQVQESYPTTFTNKEWTIESFDSEMKLEEDTHGKDVSQYEKEVNKQENSSNLKCDDINFKGSRKDKFYEENKLVLINDFVSITFPEGVIVEQEDEYRGYITYEGMRYKLNTGGGDGGLCSYEDYGKSCDYTDELISEDFDLRIWKDERGIFALNYIPFKIGNFDIHKLVIFKIGSPNATNDMELGSYQAFSESEVNTVKKLINEATAEPICERSGNQL